MCVYQQFEKLRAHANLHKGTMLWRGSLFGCRRECVKRDLDCHRCESLLGMEFKWDVSWLASTLNIFTRGQKANTPIAVGGIADHSMPSPSQLLPYRPPFCHPLFQAASEFVASGPFECRACPEVNGQPMAPTQAARGKNRRFSLFSSGEVWK